MTALDDGRDDDDDEEEDCDGCAPRCRAGVSSG
jgi:hypothetical protein